MQGMFFTLSSFWMDMHTAAEGTNQFRTNEVVAFAPKFLPI